MQQNRGTTYEHVRFATIYTIFKTRIERRVFKCEICFFLHWLCLIESACAYTVGLLLSYQIVSGLSLTVCGHPKNLLID